MLKIAKNSGLTDIVSTDGTNPISTQHPIDGSAAEVQLYLFNDDNTKYYTSVGLDAIDSVNTDESSWIEFAPDNAGSAGTYATSLSMADIGSAGTPDTTGKPFWVRITTPSVGSTQNKTDIEIQVNGTEFAV